jgi:uncharacterized protein (TIGR03437 family)
MVSSMNRLPFAFLVAAAGCLQAQTYSSITIQTSPSGATFTVDGTAYSHAANFVWPKGSEHVVAFPINAPAGSTALAQISSDGQTQYTFGQWQTNNGLLLPNTSPVQTVTADPSITSLTATVSVAYNVLLNLFNTGNPNSPVSPPTCGSPGFNPSSQTYPGIVFIGGTCYWATFSQFINAGTAVTLNAIPFPGFVFTGWDFNSGPTSAYLTSITINGPTVLAPVFAPGKLVHFLTNPLGNRVTVDHTTVSTRVANDVTTCPNNQFLSVAPQFGVPPECQGDFYFADRSSHLITGPSPQLDQTGHYWVFDSFSSNVSTAGIYATSNVNAADTVTVNFVPGATASFLTNPPGLQLTVDGRTNWPSYNFVWGLGTTHTVSAPPSSIGSNGRQYSFMNWSNSGNASQTVTIDQNAVNSGIRATANFSVLSRVIIQSSPSGQAVQVDGTSCQTPCTLDRQSGATVHVTAPTQISMGVGARLDFSSWSDGGASDHTFVVNQDLTTLTLNYNMSYQLSASSSPANGVNFQFSPASSDMFYPVNQPVSITANPNPGFKFVRWSGALSGTYPSGVVSMSIPQTVIAQVNTVPYIAPAGVMNAAGQTPTAAVGPGSIISIYGQGLASALALGSANPLSQSVGGTSVTINDTILGLMFVSPQQINAQLPSNLSDGQYTLDVHVSGQPDVTAPITVQRDAPGLFFNMANSLQYAVAFHADGSSVTAGSPATAGETISVLGTGFGPYSTPVPDGFFPPTSAPALSDSLSISLGGQTVAPAWSGAASSFVGIASTSFQIPTGLASGQPASLKVTVNGVDSNTVVVPIQ